MTVAVLCGTFAADRAPLQTLDLRMTQGLCQEPSQLTELVSETDEQLVLGLHRGHFGLSEIQTTLRALGFDPLGVPIVDLNAAWNSTQLRAMLAGAAARAAAYPGASPEQIKMRVPKGVTRRSLLTGALPSYVGAPAIDQSRCAAGDGCKVCVAQCPWQALSGSGGTITFRKDLCVSCGICVTACPVGAVVNPTATPGQIEAEVRAILQAAPAPAGIVFRCRDAIPFEPTPGWYPVEVPCTSMLSVGWILAPLVHGAAGVAAAPCSQSGCELSDDARLDERVHGARTVLQELGLSPALAGTTMEEHPAIAPGRAPGEGLFEVGGEAQVVTMLAEATSRLETKVGLSVAAAGTIQIDPLTCTTCGVCGTTCPPRALTFVEDGNTAVLTFDAARCVACGHCLTVCPELTRGAITLTAGYDVPALRRGRQILRSDTTPRCELCGGPIAPSTTLARIRELLGPDEAAAMALIERRCLSCRGR